MGFSGIIIGGRGVTVTGGLTVVSGLVVVDTCGPVEVTTPVVADDVVDDVDVAGCVVGFTKWMVSREW